MQSTGSPLFLRGTRIHFPRKGNAIPRSYSTTLPRDGWPLTNRVHRWSPYSDGGSPLSLGRTCRFPEGRVPLFPRDANPFSEGRGCTLSQERVPLPEDGDPSCEGGLALFRGDGLPFSERRVAHHRGTHTS